MAPQDDLTAERAATDMYNRLFSVMRLPEHEQHAKARLKLFYQVTRQAALREAAKEVQREIYLGLPNITATQRTVTVHFVHEWMQRKLQRISDQLDRLASEGG